MISTVKLLLQTDNNKDTGQLKLW